MPKTAVKAKSSQINVYVKEGLYDALGEGIEKDILDLAIKGVSEVRSIRVYTIIGNLSEVALRKIGGDLLADRVTQEFTIGEPPASLTKGSWVVHVKFNHGVTDAVGQTAEKGIRDLGIKGAGKVLTSTIFIIKGSVGKTQVDEICRRLLANSVIQSYTMEKH